MNLDPRTPVIVGAAQVTDRIDDPTMSRSALDLMEDALRSAAIDADALGLLPELDLIGVVGGLWRYTNPGRQVADRVCSGDPATLLTSWSGHTPQHLLNHLAARIQAGELEAAAMLGGETNRSRRRAKKLGVELNRDYDTTIPVAEAFGEPLVMATGHEQERGVDAPVTIYPLLESAIRHAGGETVDGHLSRLGDLWAGFNAVAVENPHAAVRTPMTPEEIVTPTVGNRMVGSPYTVAMNAHNNVDQASAVLILSAGRAEALGVPQDRWVFPWSGSVGLDTNRLSNRWELHRAPALRLAGRRALEAAGVGVDDLAHVDLYSCFPSSVQISSAELGIGHDRPLTVTGGLTFAGGPFNNYSGQAIAAMVALLRDEPGLGFVHANGGYATKHAIGVYGTDPPTNGPFRWMDVAEEAACLPARAADPGYAGRATIEGYSVMHGRDGSPTHALVALRNAADARVWGTSRDSATLDAMTAGEHVGVDAELSPDGLIAL